MVNHWQPKPDDPPVCYCRQCGVVFFPQCREMDFCSIVCTEAWFERLIQDPPHADRFRAGKNAMSHPWHHVVSSAWPHGGVPDDWESA